MNGFCVCVIVCVFIVTLCWVMQWLEAQDKFPFGTIKCIVSSNNCRPVYVASVGDSRRPCACKQKKTQFEGV